MESARITQLIDFQTNLMDLNKDLYDDFLSLIKNISIERVIINIIFAVRYRPQKEMLYVQLVLDLFAQNRETGNILFHSLVDPLSKRINVEDSGQMHFLYKCYEVGVIEKKHVLEFMERIIEHNSLSRTNLLQSWLFAYFMPLIFEKPQLFHRVLHDYRKGLSDLGFASAVPDLNLNIEKLSNNNYEVFRSYINTRRSEVLAFIEDDDVDSLRRCSADPSFSADSRIEMDIYEQIWLFQHNPTLIQVAAFFGSIKCFSFLMHNGASVKCIDDDGNNLAYYAVAGGNLEIIRLMEQNNVEFDNAHYASFLFHRLDLFTYLEGKIGNKNMRYFNGKGLLELATMSNHLEGVRWCVENGIYDVNEILPSTETILHIAAINNTIDVGEYLIPLMNNINMPLTGPFNENETNGSPLHFASLFNHYEFVRLLLSSRCIEINSVDFYGDTALFSVSEDGFFETAEILINDPRIDVNIHNKNGWTAFILSARNNIFYRNNIT